MTGHEFEYFLAKVFEERGYRVELTGRTGVQGVDLIVDRDGNRVAVQAKGYVGHAVGNDAIQQAFTSSTFYQCQSAAVITNSRYTFAARALAERIGCRLIDGEQIPDLVEGRIVL
jgi:restriction system protein